MNISILKFKCVLPLFFIDFIDFIYICILHCKAFKRFCVFYDLTEFMDRIQYIVIYKSWLSVSCDVWEEKVDRDLCLYTYFTISDHFISVLTAMVFGQTSLCTLLLTVATSVWHVLLNLWLLIREVHLTVSTWSLHMWFNENTTQTNTKFVCWYTAALISDTVCSCSFYAEKWLQMALLLKCCHFLIGSFYFQLFPIVFSLDLYYCEHKVGWKHSMDPPGQSSGVFGVAAHSYC